MIRDRKQIAAELRTLAVKSMQTMAPGAVYEVNTALAELDALATANAEDADLEAAARAFEEDMEPVRDAIVSALQSDDIDALKGLKAMLPGLLEDVNRDSVLSDLLAHQLGKAMLAGLHEEDVE